MTQRAIPYRVDLVMIYRDGQTGTRTEVVRQGVTPDALRHAADDMDRLSNVHPFAFMEDPCLRCGERHFFERCADEIKG